MSKVIIKFNRTYEYYMHKPESVLEFETHKILLDFEIQKYPLIPVRKADIVIINEKKENLLNGGLCQWNTD